MKKEIGIKAFLFVLIFIINILISKEVNAGQIKQTWRTNPESNLQQIAIQVINGAQYGKNYGMSFSNSVNNGYSGKTLYGGGLQGSVITDRHIIFAILSGGRHNGYIFVANKSTGTIEQSIPVASAGSTSIYGHMNDMTYNPNTKEVLLPYIDVNGKGKVAIFKYNSNGSLNTTPTIVNQCNDISCSNMDYNKSLDKYIFNSGTKIYIVSRSGNGFKSTPDKTVTYDQKDFKYMTPQGAASTGKYFYKMFFENGEIEASLQPTYADSKEQGSAIVAVYELETGNFLKALYIPNTTFSARLSEIEGISFDPSDNSMMLSYNFHDEQKVRFYKLKAGNQVIGGKELYFYNNGLTAPKATITAEKDGVSQNLIRYYNGSNNLGDGHSNYTKSWKDLAGMYNGSLSDGASFNNKGYLSLSGGNKWVNIGKMPEAIYNNVTMEIGVAFSEIPSGEEIDLLSNMEAGGYALLLVDGKPAFQAHINGKYEKVIFDEKLLTNRLYNITGTYDGNNLSLYIDGVLRVTKKVGTNTAVKMPDNNTVMAIGTNPNESHAVGGFLNGVVYTVRVYESALTLEEIQKNMNADRITTNVFSNNNSKVNLTINFSEPVANFSEEDIVVNNAQKGKTKKNNDKQYEIEITNIKENSNLEVSIANSSFTDTTGNAGLGTNIKRFRDVSGPEATITSNANDTTSSSNIVYTISFNEKVTGFNINSIVVNNGEKSNFTEVTQRQVYTVQVNNAENGNQEVSIPKAVCYDACGNPNTAKSKVIEIDKNPPIITINPNSKKASKNTNITITVKENKNGLSDNNVYEYALSDNNKTPPTSGWTQYTSGQQINIGEGITGTRYVWVKQISDKIGNKSKANQVSGAFVFDNTAPTINGVENKKCYSKPVKITAIDSDSGMKSITIKKDNVENEFNNGSTISESGRYTVKAEDKLGNLKTVEFIIDTEAPQINIENNGTYYTSVIPDAVDDLSGIDRAELKKDDNVIQGFTLGSTVNVRGEYELTVFDKAGNSSQVVFSIVGNQDPVIQVENNPTNWTKEDVNLKISVGHQSGIKTLKINNQEMQINENNICMCTITRNGTYKIDVESMDGNTASKKISVKYIDKDSPVISSIEEGGRYDREVLPEIKDDLSGIERIELYKNNQIVNYSVGNEIGEKGIYRLIAYDKAGNSKEINFEIENNLYPSIRVEKSTEEWTNQEIYLRIFVSDEEGIRRITINDQEVTNENELNIKIERNGTYKIEVENNRGNKKEKNIEIKNIDLVKPTITGVEDKKTYNKVNINVEDNESGIDTYELKSNNQLVKYQLGDAITDEGEYLFAVKDKAGNISTVEFTIEDVEKQEELKRPEIRITKMPTNWTNTSTTIEFEIKIKDENTEIDKVLVNGNEVTPKDGKYTIDITENGEIKILVIDKMGNEIVEDFYIKNIDKDKPKVKLKEVSQDWSIYKDLEFEVEEETSGVKELKINGNEIDISNTGKYLVKIEKNGEYTLDIKDNAGNSSIEKLEISKIDRTSPTIEISTQNTQDVETEIVNLKVTDQESGVKEVKVNNEIINNINKNGEYQVTVKENGPYVVSAIDNVGNSTTSNFEVNNIIEKQTTQEEKISSGEEIEESEEQQRENNQSGNTVNNNNNSDTRKSTTDTNNRNSNNTNTENNVINENGGNIDDNNIVTDDYTTVEFDQEKQSVIDNLSQKELPYTGRKIVLYVFISALVVTAIIIYVKIKFMKDIK